MNPKLIAAEAKKLLLMGRVITTNERTHMKTSMNVDKFSTLQLWQYVEGVKTSREFFCTNLMGLLMIAEIMVTGRAPEPATHFDNMYDYNHFMKLLIPKFPFIGFVDTYENGYEYYAKRTIKSKRLFDTRYTNFLGNSLEMLDYLIKDPNSKMGFE